MAKVLLRNGNGSRSAQASKYDAQNTVLSKTYGALADLRRELADSKAVGRRTGGAAAELRRVRGFAAGVAVAGGLLREALALAQGFPEHGLVAAAAGGARQGAAGGGGVPVSAGPAVAADGAERLRQPRPLRPGGAGGAGTAACPATGGVALPAQAGALRFAARLPAGGLPARSPTRSSRRATAWPCELHLLRPRTGEKVRTLGEIIELTTRAAHEQELFPPGDWEFIQWLAETHARRSDGEETMVLSDLELLHWLARWGHTPRLELAAERRAGAGAGVSGRGRRIDAAPGERRARSWRSRTG